MTSEDYQQAQLDLVGLVVQHMRDKSYFTPGEAFEDFLADWLASYDEGEQLPPELVAYLAAVQ